MKFVFIALGLRLFLMWNICSPILGVCLFTVYTTFRVLCRFAVKGKATLGLKATVCRKLMKQSSY